MADYRMIMALVLQGLSYREIVDAAGCSHREVSTAQKMIQGHGITRQRLDAMPEDELSGLFPDGRSRVTSEYDVPDFARVSKSLKSNRHFTLLQAWRTYVAAKSSLRKYGYSQYCHLFGRYAMANDLVATLHHEPGRAAFVDWVGDTLSITDAITGEAIKAYLFVAVLPYSGYVFCKAFTDMRQDAWIGAHVQALDFFAGVPQIIVPDNALTATHRKSKTDAARFVNDRYQQMADHYGTAIVPARVKRPRDKAAAESAVNTVEKRVIGYLDEELFTTLAELNAAIAERVHEINHEIRQANGTTRFERFATEEAPALAPLGADAFEEVDWKEAKVGRNYHLTVDYQHYSVPYALAGRMLRVRLTASRVTIFNGQQIAAEHRRATGRKGQYSSDPSHVPPQHRNIEGLWSRQWFTDRAQVFGPATTKVIEQVLDHRQVEAQGFLDCQNILETLGRRNKQKLEAACQQLLNMRGYPSYSTLKRLMAAIDTDAKKPAPSRAAASTKKNAVTDAVMPDVHVRGADYYREGR